jgi:hypothetical protein
MKVKIKDLYPNPYRDMDNYPINRVKVDSLKASIKQTGFWDNIVAREKDGQIQIAYGHHRLTALREALPWDTEVDIPVKDLSDSTMIQIMANENMQEYSTSPATIDETVKVAKKFLEENPNELKKYGEYQKGSVGANYVSRFLNWPESRIHYSLQRLNLIESGTVSKAAINQLPTDNAARSFTKAATKWNLSTEEQEEVANEIVESGNMGYEQIEKKISEKKFKTPKPEDKTKAERIERETQGLKFTNYCADVYNKSMSLARDIDLLNELKDEFVYLNFDKIQDNRIKVGLLSELKNLSSRINNLLKTIEDEYNTN